VGDLDSSVNDKQLLEFFSEKYPSAYFARIIYDPVTKYSKSYGFVEFSNATEAQRAITEMTGMILAGRMIRVSNANTKNTGESQTALT
jgi:RNA recognition motif-containing protein